MIRQESDALITLNRLHQTLAVDPTSFKRWNCLYFVFPEADRHFVQNFLQPQVGTLCRDLLGDHAGEVLFADHRHFFILTEETAYPKLRLLATRICQLGFAPDSGAQIEIFNLCADHAKILHRLNHILEATSPALQDQLKHRHQPAPVELGELPAFETIYQEEKRHKASRSPLRVLLVDDDVLTCRLVTKLLKQDFAVYTAHNAAEATASFLLHAPDIMFLDINLPGLSGFHVLDGIAGFDHDAYIVMFSANDNLATTAEALLHGARGFIHKPFQKESFRHYIYGAALAQGKYWN